MVTENVIYYYEATEASEKEKEEIRGLLSKLPKYIDVKSDHTYGKTPAIHYREKGEIEIVEGRENIISKLTEICSKTYD